MISNGFLGKAIIDLIESNVIVSGRRCSDFAFKALTLELSEIWNFASKPVRKRGKYLNFGSENYQLKVVKA